MSWEQMPVWALMRPRKERNRPDLPLLSIYRDYGVVLKDSRDDNHNRAGEDLGVYQTVRRGNVVMNKMKAWQGSIAVSSYDGIVSPDYMVLEFARDDVDVRYYHYLLRSNFMISEYRRRAYGIRPAQWRLMYDDFRNLFLLKPPRDKQRAIADFLDRKTAAIDALIEKKERLIALLAEKRDALVHRAVTKGLDPNVPMKDSGVPWIGQIPAHWEAKRIKFLCRLESGHTPSRSEPKYWLPEECTIPWVSLNDTKALASSDFISDTHTRISPVGMQNSSAHLIDAGAVVFTRDATIGLAAITTQPMAVSQHVIAWVCGPDVNSMYLLRVINAMVQELERLTFGATLKTIGMADIRNLWTPVPPLPEQVEIATQLNEQLARQDATVGSLRRQIQKLKEYRQSLITAAVTGQLPIPEPPT